MAASGSLIVVRADTATVADETFIRITAAGDVNAYNGHVDLGTGIRTALGQIVAEELDVSFARVVVVLGDTSEVPNQGPTIASETIQITADPLRKAAAQARRFLLARALWDSGRDRARAATLAQAAKSAYGDKAPWRDKVDAIDRWLAQHPVTPVPARAVATRH